MFETDKIGTQWNEIIENSNPKYIQLIVGKNQEYFHWGKTNVVVKQESSVPAPQPTKVDVDDILAILALFVSPEANI